MNQLKNLTHNQLSHATYLSKYNIKVIVVVKENEAVVVVKHVIFAHVQPSFIDLVGKVEIFHSIREVHYVLENFWYSEAVVVIKHVIFAHVQPSLIDLVDEIRFFIQ